MTLYWRGSCVLDAQICADGGNDFVGLQSPRPINAFNHLERDIRFLFLVVSYGLLPCGTDPAPTGPEPPPTVSPPPANPYAILGVRIEPEASRDGYDRDNYDYPASIEQRIVDQQGGVFSPYSLLCFSSTGETDIEHIVAAAEAHDGGMNTRTPNERREFTRDLANLTLAAPALNRHQKFDYDPAEWIPQNNRCWNVGNYIEVKRKYNLSMDRAEADAVLAIFQNCTGFGMVIPACVN